MHEFEDTPRLIGVKKSSVNSVNTVISADDPGPSDVASSADIPSARHKRDVSSNLHKPDTLAVR